jgi:hypothetical protein
MAELKDVNNGSLLGFRIPTATELIDQFGVTTSGSLYLTFVIRVNNPVTLLRRLEETRYSLTAANPILIKLDPKYLDPNYVESNGPNDADSSSNSNIIIIVAVLAAALVITTIVVSIVILKRRKQVAVEGRPVPNETPGQTYHEPEEKPVDVKDVDIKVGKF